MTFPVLICDDSALARKSVKRCLPEDWDVDIHFACNGQEAMNVLETQQIALLFLDLTMPVMDGIDVLTAIKQQGIEVFVIVISGDIQPVMQQKVAELGALDFIQKPVDTLRLTDVLSRFGLYCECA